MSYTVVCGKLIESFETIIYLKMYKN